MRPSVVTNKGGAGQLLAVSGSVTSKTKGMATLCDANGSPAQVVAPLFSLLIGYGASPSQKVAKAIRGDQVATGMKKRN